MIISKKKKIKEQDATLYFEDKIMKAANKIEPIVFHEESKFIQEEVNNGTLNNGAIMQKLLIKIEEIVMTAVNDTLKLIPEFQNEMKVTLTDQQLQTINIKFGETFSFVYLQCVEKYYKKNIIYIFGKEQGENITNKLMIDYIYNNIFTTANDFIEDIKSKNMLREDDVTLKLAKKSYRLSKISIIINIILTIINVTIAATTFYLKYYK